MKSNIKDVYSLTPSQEGMYAQYFQSADTKTYHFQNLCRISKETDLDILKKSVELLSHRHQILKTAFTVLKSTGAIKQVILENRKPKFSILPQGELFSQSALDNIISEDLKKPLDLQRDSLLRITIVDFTDERFMLIHTHHIILDGWCLPVIINDLQKYYGELSKGISAEELSNEIDKEVSTKTSYAQYVNWIKNQDKNEASGYWQNLLADCSFAHIFGKEKKDNKKNEDIVTFETHLSDELSQRIEQFAKESKVSHNTVFECAFGISLQKYSGSDDVVFDKVISGRSVPLKNIENTVGPFINTVPVRIKGDENITLADLLRETQNQTINANKYGIMPLAEVYKVCGVDNNSIDALFVFENYFIGDISDIEKGPLSLKLVSFNEHTEFNLTVTILKENNGYTVRTAYAKEMYTERDISNFIKGYISILDASLDETKQIKDISVADMSVIDKLNNTAADYQRDKCIHELFEEQVERTPDKVAVVAHDKTLTYRELNEEANKIAHSLMEKGIGKDDIVGLMLPRKSYLLSVLFGILKTGAAYLPIDSELPRERIEYMCEDTNARLVVSSENIDSLMQSDNISNPLTEMTNDALCYCIYTSGSTGKPKGVMAKHRNVVNYISKNEHNIAGRIIKDDFEAIVSISTCSFDIFVTETVLPLVNGFRTVLADEQQCRNQSALNKLLSKEKGEFLQTTPTKLKVLTSEPTQRDFLKNIKAILLGGEAMEFSFLKELKGITNAKIYNIYGATEVPIWSTFADTDTFADAVTIGKPIANTRVYIVDKHMNPVPIGVTGELCIAGDSVSAGYLNRPEQTAEKFIDNPFGEGKMYRTGDLAYFREDGNIVYVGRRDFQVKIRGLRIELGEIESVLQAIDNIDRAVVVVRKDKGGRQLICAFYTGEEKSAKELREVIDKSLPKYMVPHIFTHLPEMPLTTSGKANRNALPEIDLENIGTGIEYVAPETKEEAVLTKCIEDVLGIEQASTLDNFFDIGGDSLKAIELTSRLETKGYEVQVKTIFSAENIKSLAKELTIKEKEEIKVKYDSVLPATAAQLRVYTAQIMKPDSAHYNVTYAFKVKDVNKEKLEAAVNKLIARHESLRTHFENRNGQIVQIIDEEAEIKIESISEDKIYSFAKAFDLTCSPLMRVGCSENAVIVDMHHIIVDGETMPVLFKELNELYMGRELPDTVQYGEFAVKDGYTQENEKYWLDVFNREVPDLVLPMDFARKESQTFNGNVHYDLIDISLHERIKKKCKKLDITPYVFYMACFNIMLSKYSGNEDIVVGMPISGRSSRFLETVGMFVNTIALRSRPEGNRKILDLMKEIRDNSVSAIDNQNYPFGELVKKLNIEVGGRNPLYDVMFAYQSFEMTDITFADRKAELIPLTTKASKCDISFNILPRKNDVVFVAEYCTDLYAERTVQKLTDSFKIILEKALDENSLIKDIDILSQEQKKLLCEFNGITVNYNISDYSTIYSLFKENATENKSKVCISTAEGSITFGELLSLSEALDEKIRSVTGNKKSIVAVIADRSIEMYTAIYGIIRGGNAYLPISSEYPKERMEYILKDSSAALVVAQDKYIHLAGDVPFIDITAFINNQPASNKHLLCAANPDDTAYVIYTSGSTGNPKGARVSHKSAVNRILWMHDKYPLEENSVILQKTPYTFDVSVWEIFWWGMCGGSLAASKPGEHFLPAKILDEVNNNKVTHLHFVPSVFDLFLNYLESHKEEYNKFCSVKHVFLSGEALTASLIQRFYALYDYNSVKLHNLYGPTECAVDVTYYDCVADDIDPVPIGKPIYNTQMYVVDKYMNIVPIGVKGELCIGGINVGQGYLNNEKLTNEKFVDNPFGEGKLYKTGDLAYWREDGQIIFCGRMDGQVKLGGQRIEIGEIEAVIGNIPKVESVAVIMRKLNGRDALVAFYCGEKNRDKIIRSICETKLPKYMVPAAVCHIEELPLNQSGKLDRKALFALDVDLNEFDDFEEPVNECEKTICDAFREVLEEEKIGRNSDFFDLGGSSLLMISVLSEDMFKDIAPSDFIANPTPKKLAKLIKDKKKAELKYLETLREAENAEKSIVLFPFAGGGAEAYTGFVNSVKAQSNNISLYFVRYLHSKNECEEAAKEISSVLKETDVYFYSHCVGSAIAMQILRYLEKDNLCNVKHYVAGASVPPKNPQKKNAWDVIPDKVLKAVLVKAGAPLNAISDEKAFEMLKNFRADTDFAVQAFAEDHNKIKVPVSVVISKRDMFTSNYKQAEKMWKKYAETVKNIYFIDSPTHYFQADNSDELVRLIFSITD